MNGINNRIVAAAFTLLFATLSPAVTLTISPAPTLGNVTSNVGGINCGTGGSSCVSSSITTGASVTLTAAPTSGGCTFVQWNVTSLGTSTANPLTFPMPATAQTGSATFHGLAPSITSVASTTFQTGSAGSFNVTGTGCSSPTFSITAGSLPSGVTLATNGTLSGTPAFGTGGSYPVTITASNGTAPSATQSFTLAVNQVPTITSAASTIFTVGAPGTFNFTATGWPAPSFAITSGALPAGVTLTSAGLLSGTSSTTGTYQVWVTASNGIAPDATQFFTLAVNQPPAITSAATTATFAVGAAGAFNFTATGWPAPTFAITSGGIPEGVTFFSDGTLSGTPASGTAGVYPFTVAASNSAGPDATVNFTLTVTQTPGLISVPMQNFMGLGSGFTGPLGSFTVPTYPSDTGIAVGPNHIVQVANWSYAAFDKAGTVLAGPKALTTLWPSPPGNPCAQSGEQLVRYDRAADRFVIAQDVFDSGSQRSMLCVAVSQTADPTGAYYTYQFASPTGTLFDAPRWGVWPDGYYVTFNRFGVSSGLFQGVTVCAANRSNMLAGMAATWQCFDESSSYFTLLPSDLDSANPPPAGAPNYVVGLDIAGGALQVFQMHVDWNFPMNTTFTGPTVLTTAPYADPVCGAAYPDCVPQGGTSTLLDVNDGRLMYRAAYRNFGNHESIVVLHAAHGTSSTGVRWYELRSPGASPTIFQQGTFAPDADHRWVASGAMDGFGNLALGYSVSSSTIKPQVRYAARLANDPLGQLSRGEATIVAGGASQTGSQWGHTTALQIDPSDDCTFWYTNQYLPASLSPWQTRIASFRILPSCSPAPGVKAVNDLDGDGKSDLLWKNTADGSMQAWLMNGLSATAIAGLLPAGGYNVTHVADLNGDGFDDLLIRASDGSVIAWLMNGLTVTTNATLLGAGSGWSIAQVGDLDGDGKADLILQHTDGTVVAWLMNGTTVTATTTFVPAGTGWSIAKVADLNGDGKADLVWQHTDGSVQAWLMNGLSVAQIASFVPAATGWSPVMTADFNGDGMADILWQHTDGRTQLWLMNGLSVTGLASFTPAGTGWVPKLAGDIDGDGKADLFWEHTTGASQTWLMNGTVVPSLASFVPAGTGWTAAKLLDLNGDGKLDVLWKHTSGGTQAWLMNGLTITQVGSLTPAGTYVPVP